MIARCANTQQIGLDSAQQSLLIVELLVIQIVGKD